MLSDVVAERQPRSVLEVGHYNGLSTVIIWDALRDGAEMVTIDHHWGDKHSDATEPWRLFDSLRHCQRPLNGMTVAFRSYEAELAERGTVYDFVFYDGPHSDKDCRQFWALVQPHLSRSCVVAFDDADWDEMGLLRNALLADDFTDATPRGLTRGAGDKRCAGTYTIAVYERGHEVAA